MKLIFASNNPHKLEEMRFALGHQLEILSLKEAGIHIDIPEPHESLEENASEKSRTIYQLTWMNCFSEDTGLEVEALNGRPGVRSARYAGDEKSFDKNIEKLLGELESETNRKARFRAVISLIWNGHETLFEGIINGKIIHEKRGHSGFGYDPVFIPEGSEQTFAEMSPAEKNKYSHRRRAVEKMVAFLSQQHNFISSPKTKAGP
jgi:XTP/dITP diphosphohydrolase